MGARAGVAGFPGVRAGVTAGLLVLAAAAAPAQEPAPQDTAARPAADTVAADTVPPDTMPILPTMPYPDAWVVARWDRSELLIAGALTLGELLARVPELTALRFGFLEGPSALVCCGTNPAAVRYTVNGDRVLPQGVAALEPLQFPLAELESVTVRRVAGGYRVDLTTVRMPGRPYSTIEGGTGDYDVTLLRAVYLGPFFGGAVGFGFDRVETRGFGGLSGAERVGVYVSYARRLPLGLAGAVEWRRSGVDRGELAEFSRSDVVARLRRPFGDRWTADLSIASARTAIDSLPGGTTPTLREEAVSFGFQAAYHGPALEAALRVEGWNGDGVPDRVLALEGAWRPAAWLALGGDARHSRWGGANVDEGAARLRLEPVDALSLQLELEAGARRIPGAADLPLLTYRRSTARADVRVAGFHLSGAVGRWRATPSLPLGLPFDGGLPPLPGGDALVWRASGSAPTPIEPIRLVAAYERRDAGPFLYWPLDRFAGGGRFHGLYLDGQLEIRGRFDVVVRGPMRSVALETGAPTIELRPRRLGSEGEVVVRVKDVRLFWTFEGFRNPDESADVGGAPFPQSRTVFGLKWEFWN